MTKDWKLKDIQSVVLIGNGAVAGTMCKHLQDKGFPIIGQYGRNNRPSIEGIHITDNISKINTKADIYIIAVNDDAIEEIVDKMPRLNGLVVHTAGSVDTKVFSNKFPNYGVLYPLQSFSKHREINVQETPFLIEANSENNTELLSNFAKKMSDSVIKTTYEKRLKIHLAAVFASNFANHMASIASLLLTEADIQFEIMKPLLEETYNKILTDGSMISQTGPAKRNDIKILEKHTEMLTSNPIFQEIYQTISTSIFQMHNKE